jgi:hypothetical protein
MDTGIAALVQGLEKLWTSVRIWPIPAPMVDTVSPFHIVPVCVGSKMPPSGPTQTSRREAAQQSGAGECPRQRRTITSTS